ncbi:EAL domain-containing protein [Kineosporia sp. J2-2]|uniref:EAL domain-containing protein n=1 Tax=Kineosporia corallincola TaxID=2835133 RepID=A0ABS5TM56_9ACTN|nr:EAL domain-containing protein [Kineosporia corallincola]MBT0772182.1 EAL domain-containing protein [Kineosporia corallincola]
MVDAGRESGEDFVSAAQGLLSDLRAWIGLESWSILRRDDGDLIVMLTNDETFGMHPGLVTPWSESYCRQVVEWGRPEAVADASESHALSRAVESTRILVRAAMLVPLRSPEGKLLGALAAVHPHPVPQLEQQLPAVRRQAALLGALLGHELSAQQEHRREQSPDAEFTDPLTGLANRRAWDDALRSEDARAARYASSAAVLVLDIDGLRRVNAGAGHSTGDDLLITTAAVLSGRMRSVDFVARIGGDEFGVLMPETTAEEAGTVLVDLRKSLSAAGITASFGIGQRRSNTGLQAAWRAADVEMYADKLQAAGSRIPRQTAVPAEGETVAAPHPAPADQKEKEPYTGPERRRSRARVRRGADAAIQEIPEQNRTGENPERADDPEAVNEAVDAAVVTGAAAAEEGAGEATATGEGAPEAGQVEAAAAVGRRLTSVDALLQLAKDQLGMEVAFLGTFEEAGWQQRVRNLITTVDVPLAVGQVHPADDTYCKAISDGRLGPVIPDTSKDPVARSMPVTRALNIGAHVGVPLHRRDGRLYGSLCTWSTRPDEALRERDADVLRAIGTVVMELVDMEDRTERDRHKMLDRMDRLMANGGPGVVFQAVHALDGLSTIGVEALSRFPAGSGRPDEWFNSATRAGVGLELELAAVRNALTILPALRGFLAINVSPRTLVSPAFGRLVTSLPLKSIVIEVTEHEAVDDYDALNEVLRPWRDRGMRIAVDDAGAGFASMRHVLTLVPDFIKLDISLVRGIDTDPAKRALAGALAAFAQKIGSSVIAEGIETAAELACLRGLRVGYGQGYHLSLPGPLADEMRKDDEVLPEPA